MTAGSNLTLLTDLYQLTMAQGYWKQGWHEKEAVFHLFYRKAPFGGAYAIASGLAQVIDYLEHFRFTVEQIQYLGRLKDNRGQALFEESFLNYLQRMELSCDVDAVPEGTAVFPHSPLIRIRGPLLQAQLLETSLLNLVNFSTLISTKAARIVEAAQGDSVLEFGLRRAQGPNGALTASRAAYVGGCHATSNVLAGQLYGIPVKGTHAHSWVMSFDTELEAFEHYAHAMPGNCVFLVDTYDTLQGVRNAIKVGEGLRGRGYQLAGIRLDSGDLAELSKKARQMLDAAGFTDAAIVASDSLDEYRIRKLKEAGAKVSVWGVGTRLATAYDQAALGGVYKLAAIRNQGEDWEYRIKYSEDAVKVSNPGVLDTLRVEQDGRPVCDIIYNAAAPRRDNGHLRLGAKQYSLSDGQRLLTPVYQAGKLVYRSPSLAEMRERAMRQNGLFPNDYSCGLDEDLQQLKRDLTQRHLQQREG